MRVPTMVKKLTLVMMLTWISTGCYVPIKWSNPDYRDHFPAEAKEFTPGESTRADVLLKMGEPDERSPDGTLFTYNWSRGNGVLIVSQCGPSVSFIETTSFVFTFDEEGILKSLDIFADNDVDVD